MPLEETAVQSLADWLGILDWRALPNFGNCHTQPNPANFRVEYYANEALQVLYKNICTTMSAGVNAANVRITGNPGAGKTSFVYAIKDKADAGTPILKKFFFYIFHINRAHGHETGEHGREVLQNVRRAWEQFYEACGLADLCVQLIHQGGDTKDEVNRLADYYVSHKETFKKCCVFVVDNADLLPSKEVAEIATELLRHLEQASVKKWLVLRGITFDNYDGKTKTLIEQFFPDPYSFPNIALHDLIQHRIAVLGPTTVAPKTTGPLPKMPFSRDLCEEVDAICDHNLREGLSLLKSILEDNLPKGISRNADERFIQEYLSKAAVRSYLSSNKLVDLHAGSFRVSGFPLAADILCCASHHASESIVFGAVNDCVAEREAPRHSSHKFGLATPQVRKSDFELLVRILEEHRLLQREKAHDLLRITPLGRILASFVPRDSYYDFCRLKTPGGSGDSEYWGRAAKPVDHSAVVERLLIWRSQR